MDQPLPEDKEESLLPTEPKRALDRSINWSKATKKATSVNFEADLLETLMEEANRHGVSLSLFLNSVLRNRSTEHLYMPAVLPAREVSAFLGTLAKLRRLAHKLVKEEDGMGV